MKKISMLLLMFMLAVSQPGWATDEPIRITIGYLPDESDKIEETLVISREKILASQAASVSDLLGRIAGLHVEQAAGTGSVSSIYIRGADPNFTVVLIDGVKVNDPTNSRGGSFDFSSLSLDEIESIEISRSALSAVYGSDAISGVISIRTRPQHSATRASVTVGSNEFYRISAGTTHIGDSTDYGISVNKNDDGQAITGQRSQRKALNTFFRQQIYHRHYFDVQARYAEGHHHAFPDDSGGQHFAVIREQDDRQNDATTFALNYQYKPGGSWEIFAKYDYFRLREDVTSPGVAPGQRDASGIPANAFTNNFKRHRLLLYGNSKLSDSFDVVAGVEYTRENGNSEGNLDFGFFRLATDFSRQRNNRAAFAELHFVSVSQVALQASYRVDDPDGFASTSNARIAMFYTDGNVRYFFRTGQGFKLPSFFALGHPIVGNSRLRPETSLNTELGLHYSFINQAADLQLSIFRNIIHDLVDLQETPVLQLVNRDKVILQGGDAELALSVSKTLRLALQASYVDADVRNSNEQLRSRPRWRAGGTLAWQITREMFFNYHVEYVGSIFDSSIPTGDVTLGDYIRSDLNVNYQLDAKTTYHFSIDNLFNSSYETAAGFVGTPRQLRAGIRLKF